MALFHKQRKAVGIVLFAALTIGTAHSKAADPQFLDQNWSNKQRQDFYTMSQGSQIMPYEWFWAMEQANNKRGFFSDGLARHGYLPNPDGPDGLPVGFAIDKDDKGWWVGMTCAACHTSQVTYKGTLLQIDGGPTQADMYALLVDIRDTLQATIKDPGGAKFGRFARKVLKQNYSPTEAAKLHRSVASFTKEWADYVEHSRSDHPWGRARLDAFGMIFNRVSAIDLGIPANNSMPNAPTSYPFLWGTPYEDKVQWNGSAPNKSVLDRLGRNVGEVLGVFAKAKLSKPSRFPLYYRTTARRTNLLKLESLSEKLTSPVWPEDVLGSIDQAKARAGAVLFQDHCVGCHEIIPHGQQNTKVDVVMTPIKEINTDPMMAKNACEKTVSAGPLAGKKMPPLVGQELPARPKAFQLVGHVVTGAILSPSTRRQARLFSRLSGDKKDIDLPQELIELGRSLDLDRLTMSKSKREETSEQLQEFLAARPSTVDCGPDSPLMAYKGRPLDGIWATAPYLHNGSVANLYEILLPAQQRTTVFHVGSREFDPVKVGYETKKGPGTSKLDTTLPGNANSGHDTYGNASFTEEERWQLVEYMKTL